MVKNSGGNKAKGKARKIVQNQSVSYDKLTPSEEQAYARIISVYGGGRYQVELQDECKKLGVLCGKLKRGRRPKLQDLVCVSLRDYQDDKCDIIYVYNAEEIQVLMANDKAIQTFYCGSLNDEGGSIEFGEESWEDL